MKFKGGSNMKKFLKEWFSLIGIVLLVLVFSLLSQIRYGEQYFLTAGNWRTILMQTAPTAIVALGQALILLTGNFDLSLGRTVCLTSCLGALMMTEYGMNTGLSVLVMLLLGVLIGAVNGVLVSFVKVPAMIATLGTQYITYGIAKLVTNASPVVGLPASIGWLGTYSVPIMLFLYLLAEAVTRYTPAGRLLYAVGGSRKAAFYAGIRVKKVYFVTFLIGGFLSAFGGLVLMARMNSATIASGQGYEFDAVIAAIIGGVSLSGGKGKILGTLFGCLFLITLFNGFSLLGIDPFVQDILKGAVLVSAILLDVLANRKED